MYNNLLFWCFSVKLVDNTFGRKGCILFIELRWFYEGYNFGQMTRVIMLMYLAYQTW